MQLHGGSSLLNGGFDLRSLVEHGESVQAGLTLEAVYGAFREHTFDFAAVVDARRYVGIVSRGRVGFLLGARFGFALYAKQPVTSHMLPAALALTDDTPLLAVLKEALSRSDSSFYDDVALLDGRREYLGMIPVRRLIAVQSAIVAEQSRLAQAQQAELADKNQQLFRSVHELRQSQGRYEALLKNSALGIALVNHDGTVDVHNPRTEELFGLEVEGRGESWSLMERLAPGHRAEFQRLLRQHEAGGGAALGRECEFSVCTPARGDRLFRFFTAWIPETGQVCVQIHDVTEQRALERQVALHEKSSLFESLVGGIAHELNNKLSPVLGYAELLSDGFNRQGAPPDAAEYCARISESAQEASKIIRQLLQLSRPPAMEMEACDLAALVAEARDMMSYRLRSGGTDFVLAAPPTPVCVLADPSQFKQVLLNLMVNAIDAMEGSARRVLTVTIGDDRDGAIVEVGDTGHGIRADHLGRIFDPFFTTKAPDRGTGLGLCVCLSIVRQHRGEITVRSTPGAGSQFEIRLPLAQGGAETARRRGALPEQGRLPLACASEPRPRLRVMIVDDEPHITALIQETLRQALGWRVEQVRNGREAIERAQQGAYDLLVSDVRMPEVDGLALYDWLRQHQPALARRTLFVTGDAGSAQLTSALLDLGRPVLYKPFTTRELIDQCLRVTAP